VTSKLRYAAACLPLLALLGYLVATAWFLCDDAFISFRYARNLLDGDGLVFNPGEYVEGYTNLLWVLEVAGLWALGVRPEHGALWLSLLCTVVTLLVVATHAARLAEPRRRRLGAWLALAWLCCCPSFAEWTTSGLETRQFTMLVVLGAWLVAADDEHRAGGARMWLASLAFGLAALTRPEAPLLAACAVGWRLVRDWLAGDLRVRRLVALCAPFALTLAGLFAWRYGYYGQWLPNTYYAKHVRPWYDSGLRYLEAGAIVLGAWLWGTLALVGVARRRLLPAWDALLPFAVVLPHALYLAHIGGDHFAFRPMDFYLPLIAPFAAAATLRLANGVARDRERLAGPLAVAATIVGVVYANAIGAASFVESRRLTTRAETAQLHVVIDADRFAQLDLLPFAATWTQRLNELRGRMAKQFVAAPVHEHDVLARKLIAEFAPYEAMPRDLLPADATAALGSVGVIPFYLRDVDYIDVLGLTDATVARTPSTQANDRRRMAHDRRPPVGYLRARDAWLWVHASAKTADQGLAAGSFALRVRDDLWMPFESTDLLRPPTALPAERLQSRHRVDAQVAERNEVLLDGLELRGAQLLATFDGDADALTWTTSGAAAIAPTPEQVYGAVGPRVLATTADKDDAGERGDARSSAFTCEADEHLVLFVAGSATPDARIELLVDERVVHTMRPALRDVFQPIALPMRTFAGRALQLRVHDDGDGWVAIDHVLRARGGPTPRAARSGLWSALHDQNLAVARTMIQMTPLERAADGLARAGATTMTFANPLPVPATLEVELVRGAPLVALRLDPLQDPATGAAIDAIAPGATGARAVHVELDAELPAACDWPLVRVRLVPHDAAARAKQPGLSLDMRLPWRSP